MKEELSVISIKVMVKGKEGDESTDSKVKKVKVKYEVLL